MLGVSYNKGAMATVEKVCADLLVRIDRSMVEDG